MSKLRARASWRGNGLSNTAAGTAVVTGAGRGIGRAVAERLARDGFAVVAADRDGAAAKETAALVGGRAVECDVSDEASVAALADEVEELRVLVNNAGIWRFTPIAHTSVDDVMDVLRVNVLGTLLCTKHLAPKMMASGGGSIVNLTSITARAVTPAVGIYPASKAAIIALTKQTALEFASGGVRANAVGPGMIVTEGTLATYGDTAETQAAAGAVLPLGRLGEPADIADVISFLASDDARYVTGQVLFVDGGLTEATTLFMGAARRSG